MPLKLLLNGARGRMGIAIAAIAEDNNAEIVSACDVGDDPRANIDTCEAIIEFSFHEVTLSIAELAVEKNIPLVIGTTGHTAEEKAAILSTVEGKTPVVWAGNYSVGVNTLNYLTRKAAGRPPPQICLRDLLVARSLRLAWPSETYITSC